MKKIPHIISKNLHDLFVVGGAVRDITIGKEPEEYDLITTTPLEEIGFKTFKESKKGQTVGTFIKGTKYDISHYEELDYDLKRRDFTINSLATPVDEEGNFSVSEMVDICGGVDDLKNKILRSYLPFENMKSDPIRIIRGLRFISKYDLYTDANTLEAMKDNIRFINDVARERLFLPLDGFVRGKYFSRAAEIAKELEINEYLGMPIVNFGIISDLNPECRWAAIFIQTNSIGAFEQKASIPSKIVRSISRINDFLNQIENKRYDWTIKIKPEEAECLSQIMTAIGINPSVIKKKMTVMPEITPLKLKNMGIDGKEISKKMIDIWKEILEK